MGKALADAFPICRETFAEADAALGEPLSRLCFEGPEDQLTLTENTQPAILAVSIAAYRLLASRGRRAGVCRRPQSRRVLGERRRRHVRVRRRAADRAAARPLHAGGRAGRRRARWRRFSVSTPTGGAGVCAEAARGRGRQPGEPERRGPGRHRRRARRRRARRRARESARRQARHAAAGERAVSLRADEAGRGSPGARTARAGDVRTRACRSSPTSTPSRSATRAPRSRRSWRRCRRRSAGKRSSRRLASEGVTTYVEVGPGTVLSGLVRKIHREATVRQLRRVPTIWRPSTS